MIAVVVLVVMSPPLLRTRTLYHSGRYSGWNIAAKLSPERYWRRPRLPGGGGRG